MHRILMMGPVPPPYGGIASLMDDMIHSELTRDYSFDVFPRSAPFPPGVDGPVSRSRFRLKRFLKFFHTLWTGNYDVVHIHSADPAFMGTTIFMLLARLARVKVLLHMQGTDWEEFYPGVSRLKRWVTRIGLNSASVIVVLYSLWIEKIKEICPKPHVTVVRNLIHKENPPDPALIEKTRSAFNLQPEHFVVLTVGTVGIRKGSFEIIKALPRVVREEPLVRFVFVGGEEEPGEMTQLVNEIRGRRLESWVILTDEIQRKEVPLFLALANIFLLPSFVEGMPVAIIEAMRSGLPVISTRVAAIPDMIDDGTSGILINPGAPGEIADAVLLLKRNDTLRIQIAEASSRAFHEKFEFSRGIEEIRTLYQRLTDR